MSQHSSRRERSSRHDDKRSPNASHHTSRQIDRHSGSSKFLHETDDAELMSGNFAIEADGEFEAERTDVNDEDLDAAFEAEHGVMFKVIDEVGTSAEGKFAPPSNRDEQLKKYVIPKLKRSEKESQQDADSVSSEEEKREWQNVERDNRNRDSGKKRGDRDWDFRRRSRDSEQGSGKKDQQGGDSDKRDCKGRVKRHIEAVKKDPHNGISAQKPSQKQDPDERQSLFDKFTEGELMSSSQARNEQNLMGLKNDPEAAEKEEETAMEVERNVPNQILDEEGTLEIPMGRDSLVFVRDYYPWQVRLHPIRKTDMAQNDFVQMWAMADSSSVVWSSHTDFGGVAEFLLKDRMSIQKFMRKILWHNFSADVLMVEVTEQVESDTASSMGQESGNKILDVVANQVVFKFHNTRARQLIKTFYPTPKGEVTERSLYVNNVHSSSPFDLLKAVFPCAAKISIARAANDISSGLVETESEEAAFNYLVVYHEIKINDMFLVLTTVKHDWEGAKKAFEEKLQSKKKTGQEGQATDASKPALLKTPASKSTKRPADSAASTEPAKRGRGGVSSKGTSGRGGRGGGSQTGLRGAGRGGGSSTRGGRGRGGTPAMGTGRGLLPDPVISQGDGLLPLPEPLPPPSLLGLPCRMEEDVIPEADYRARELSHIRHELESEVMETHAKLQSKLSQLDQISSGLAPRPRRQPEYIEEEPLRERPRRTLLPSEGPPRMEREEWPEEVSSYRHHRQAPPAERGYGVRDYREPRDRVYEDSSGHGHPRPYLLEHPEMQPGRDNQFGDGYDYDHGGRRSPDLAHDDRQSLLGRAPLLERDRAPLLERDRTPLLERDRAPLLERDRSLYREERQPRSRDPYEYEGRESRRQPYPREREGYVEDGRRSSRYREETRHGDLRY